MKSEIENMFINAGLQGLWVERYDTGTQEVENWYPSYREMIKSMMQKNGWTLQEAQNTAKKECNKEFPEFTAEKQIKIIELLANRKGYPDYEHFGALFDDYAQFYKFSTALAKLVNSIWLEFTKQEMDEIKNILKGDIDV